MKKRTKRTAAARRSQRPRRKAVARTRRAPSAPGSRNLKKTRAHLIGPAELSRLQERLREAQETLEAIRTGAVDAVVVTGPNGSKVYSLAGAEQPYRVYVERMQEGAVTVSSDGVILYCNHRFAQMLELPLERVISSAITRYIGVQAWQSLTAVFGAIDEVVKHETTLRDGERSILPVNLTASHLPLEGQDVLCLVVTDLTEQKEKADLRIAKELAEKASVAKDTFLAALSHELRTPLTPALMTAAALEQDATLPEDVRREVRMIRRNVELEARLIDDLLDLTRIACGKLELHAEPMDVHLIVERALEICRREIEAKQQRLILQLKARRTQTSADPVRLQQAVWNVVRNAAKFTPTEGTITIRTSNRTDAMLVIEVEDTGIGFTPEAAPRLFEAFEQGGRDITRQFGGLGLGLPITRSILEAHGGRILAASPGPHQGATFTLELPLVAAPAGNGHASSVTVAAATGGGGLRILLVEDHADTRAGLVRLLTRDKHDVKAASCAREALGFAESASFDVVISDLGLPDQSGLELMRLLRERYGLDGIAVSGYGMEQDLVRSRQAGFLHHLTKPVRIERLRRVLSMMSVRATG